MTTAEATETTPGGFSIRTSWWICIVEFLHARVVLVGISKLLGEFPQSLMEDFVDQNMWGYSIKFLGKRPKK